ncbi:MTH1187 family thiamine-binding protein [Peptoniphilus sp.]|uniref:MTH1187 family thiamine-binding protein n=1 Tax=Peptoniphilus sp. TaxID=1971214 RepID=UPI002A82ED9A|nr:MTH1187 family thiamine-binding protein [Peptoniphilus sp.]MDY3902949.1 MTH1187 family thiamine-binding protein [Peptoniphilus sp.]
MAVAELTLVPIGTNSTSISKYIANALDSIGEIEGLTYELNPMGTVISHSDLSVLYDVIRKMQESVFENGANRVYSVIKIDDRRDKNYTFKDKVKSVNEKRKTNS